MLYQFSSLAALVVEVAVGGKKVGELRERFDTGLGGLHKYGGEVIAVDGDYYLIDHNGKTRHCMDDEELFLFNGAAFDENVPLHEISSESSKEDFENLVLQAMGTHNHFAVFRYDGVIKNATIRCVKKLKTPPYTIMRALENWTVTSWEDEVPVIIIGVYCPTFSSPMCIAGFHLHVLRSDTKEGGGHLADYTLGPGKLQIMAETSFELELPNTPCYKKANFDQDIKGILEEIGKMGNSSVKN